MARTKNREEDTTVTEGNIKNLELLNKEFVNDKIEPRRLIALRVKLIQLFNDGIITDGEQSLMEKILKRDRIKGTILSSDNYLLNTIEASRTESSCIVKVDDGPQTHHLVKYLKCKFVKDFDTDKFIVFVPREVPVEHQITKEIAYKRINNLPVAFDELPKPRILIHRLVLSQKEFKAWFDVTEEDIDFMSEDSREEYTF